MTETDVMRRIGSNIKLLLNDTHITQKELVEKTLLDKSTISRYINGERMPSVKNLINIAYALDCDISDIVDVTSRID